MKKILIFVALTLVLLPLLPSGGNLQASQIAQWVEVFGGNDFQMVNNGTSNRLHGTSTIWFFFQVPNALGLTPRQATLTLDVTTTLAPTLAAGNFTQYNYAGTFQITDNLLSTTLLSGTLGGLFSQFGASQLGRSAMLQDSTPPPTELIFDSDYLNFPTSTSYTRSMAIAFSNSNIPITTGLGGYFVPFTVAGSGTFSADYVPEPAALVLMGSGLLALGFVRRSRRGTSKN